MGLLWAYQMISDSALLIVCVLVSLFLISPELLKLKRPVFAFSSKGDESTEGRGLGFTPFGHLEASVCR